VAPCAQSSSPPYAAAICIAVVSVSGGVIILSEHTVVVIEGIGPESTSASKPLVVRFQLLQLKKCRLKCFRGSTRLRR